MLSHFGICVTDLDRSRTFYRELFGFQETYARQVTGDQFARLMQRPSLDVEVVMLTLADKRIELIHHYAPPAVKQPIRPTNTVGLMHVAMYVPDVKATATAAADLGGVALWDTYLQIDVQGETREYMYVLDPDEVRIELIRGAALG
jgi:catechol 2,3-dioxygenase-like lactoylglutathione lyase family enzyme